MEYLLETQRLRLRELALTDTAFIIALLNSPGWLQFIGDRNVRDEAQAVGYLENGPFKSYKENGFGLFLAEEKASGLPIGLCGLLQRDYLDCPDIGFAFLPEFQGQGYAHEIASATLDYAKETLAVRSVVAITLPENTRSIALLEKIGLKFRGEIMPKGEVLSLYRIDY